MMMNMKTTIPTLLLLSLLVIGCEKETAADAVEMESGTLYDYTGLDGCSWIIQLADGTKFEPANLGDFPVTPEDGKQIYFTYTPLDAGSICMVGKVIEIQSIRE